MDEKEVIVHVKLALANGGDLAKAVDNALKEANAKVAENKSEWGKDPLKISVEFKYTKADLRSIARSAADVFKEEFNNALSKANFVANIKPNIIFPTDAVEVKVRKKITTEAGEGDPDLVDSWRKKAPNRFKDVIKPIDVPANLTFSAQSLRNSVANIAPLSVKGILSFTKDSSQKAVKSATSEAKITAKIQPLTSSIEEILRTRTFRANIGAVHATLENSIISALAKVRRMVTLTAHIDPNALANSFRRILQNVPVQINLSSNQPMVKIDVDAAHLVRSIRRALAGQVFQANVNAALNPSVRGTSTSPGLMRTRNILGGFSGIMSKASIGAFMASSLLGRGISAIPGMQPAGAAIGMMGMTASVMGTLLTSVMSVGASMASMGISLKFIIPAMVLLGAAIAVLTVEIFKVIGAAGILFTTMAASFKVASSFQALEVQMSNMRNVLGTSMSEYTARHLRNMSMMNPIGDMGMMSRDFVRLMAASGGSLSERRSLQIIDALYKLGAVSGASAQDTHDAMRQLTQMLSSNTIQGQQMRILYERVPGMRAAVQNTFGVSDSKGLSAANITPQQLLEGLADYAKGLNEPILSMTQLFQRAKNILEVSLANIGAPLVRFAEDIGKRLIPFLQALTHSADIMEGIGQALYNVMDVIFTQLLSISPTAAVLNMNFKELSQKAKDLNVPLSELPEFIMLTRDAAWEFRNMVLWSAVAVTGFLGTMAKAMSMFLFVMQGVVGQLMLILMPFRDIPLINNLLRDFSEFANGLGAMRGLADTMANSMAMGMSRAVIELMKHKPYYDPPEKLGEPSDVANIAETLSNGLRPLKENIEAPKLSLQDSIVGGGDLARLGVVVSGMFGKKSNQRVRVELVSDRRLNLEDMIGQATEDAIAKLIDQGIIVLNPNAVLN